jgi:FixJ family two-component response regulator
LEHDIDLESECFMQVVAVIEDDPSMRTSVTRVLQASGYICETYSSAEEYLDGLDTSKANSVLIDIHMDGLSGIELCKRLTASGRFLNVILMTGIDIEANEAKAFSAGCNAYLHKPFSSRSLIDAIEKRVSA